MLRDAFVGLSARVPGRCAVCARWPSHTVCGPCRERFARPGHRCRRCALTVPEGVAECGACVREPPPLDACFAAVDYGYPWQAQVARFKFRGEPGWARTLAGLMLQAPGAGEAVAHCDLVLPIPLSPQRIAARGFNQAHELARRIAPAGKLAPGLLLRTMDTPPQAALGRQARLANVRSAFAAEPLQAARLRGARCLLVDDVMTSGASLFAAARVLRAAGAQQVAAIVLARTPE